MGGCVCVHACAFLHLAFASVLVHKQKLCIDSCCHSSLAGLKAAWARQPCALPACTCTRMQGSGTHLLQHSQLVLQRFHAWGCCLQALPQPGIVLLRMHALRTSKHRKRVRGNKLPMLSSQVWLQSAASFCPTCTLSWNKSWVLAVQRLQAHTRCAPQAHTRCAPQHPSCMGKQTCMLPLPHMHTQPQRQHVRCTHSQGHPLTSHPLLCSQSLVDWRGQPPHPPLLQVNLAPSRHQLLVVQHTYVHSYLQVGLPPFRCQLLIIQQAHRLALAHSHLPHLLAGRLTQLLHRPGRCRALTSPSTGARAHAQKASHSAGLKRFGKRAGPL